MISGILSAPIFAIRNAGKAFSSLLSPKEPEKGLLAPPSAVEKEMSEAFQRKAEPRDSPTDQATVGEEDVKLRAEKAEQEALSRISETKEGASETQEPESEPAPAPKKLPSIDEMSTDELATLAKQRTSYTDEEQMFREAENLGMKV